MTELYLWIKNILVSILAISFFQILIPDSGMSAYLKFIFSLMILASVLEPVFQLMNRV